LYKQCLLDDEHEKKVLKKHCEQHTCSGEELSGMGQTVTERKASGAIRKVTKEGG